MTATPTDALLLRRGFNRWFSHNYQDADGRFTHLPRWFKSDLWDVWQAARLDLQRSISKANPNSARGFSSAEQAGEVGPPPTTSPAANSKVQP